MVVADEVRRLAQHSDIAAKDIGNLIKESAGRVEARTAETATPRVASLIREIASASEEQSDGIKQVNLAVA